MATHLNVDGKVLAIRYKKGNKVVVEMQVTKSEWETYKYKEADLDGYAPTLNTALVLRNLLVEEMNCEVVWLTPQEFNLLARQLRQHRLYDNFNGFEEEAVNCERQAKERLKETLQLV